MKQEPFTRETRIKKLLYQSWYRGCKETDKILGGFARAHIHELSDDELEAFEQLLDYQDWDIYRWVTGEQEPPANIAASSLFQKIKAFDVSGMYS